MLPNNCFTSTFYSYTADVYYATSSQDEYGGMVKEWTYDRTVKCSVFNIYEDSSNDRPMLMEGGQGGGGGKFMAWDDSYIMRTSDNIFYDGYEWHTPNDILVTNVKNQNGVVLYRNFADDGSAVKFEVRGVMNVMGPFGDLDHYKVNLVRSNDQDS